MITMITTGYRVSTDALVSPHPPHNCLRSPYIITDFYPNISRKQHFCWPKFFGVSAAALAVYGATCMESLHRTIRQFVIKYVTSDNIFFEIQNHIYCKSFNELVIKRVAERKCPDSYAHTIWRNWRSILIHCQDRPTIAYTTIITQYQLQLTQS